MLQFHTNYQFKDLIIYYLMMGHHSMAVTKSYVTYHITQHASLIELYLVMKMLINPSHYNKSIDLYIDNNMTHV